jgi:DNA-binding GntR family transcriptional regulator
MTIALKLQPGVERTRLSDAVYETLFDAILSGRLAAGAIVSEVSLAKQLEVSRTPVHDALRQLAKDGLVEQQAGRRAVIASFSRDDVFDIFEMRKILECEAARRAATRIDRATLAALRAGADSLKANRGHADWLAQWAVFDETFHGALAKASGSRRLAQDIVRYRILQRGFHRWGANIDNFQRGLDEHVRILDALEKRDADAAAKGMLEHLQEWQAYFVNHFPR